MKRQIEAFVTKVRSGPWQVFAAAFAVRFVLFLTIFVFVGPKGFELGDSQQYLGLAHSLLDGQGFALDGVPFFFRTIGYPLFLAGGLALFRSTAGFILFQILLASFLPLLVLKLGDELGLGKRVALVAAWFAAFEPHLAYYSVTVMTESIYTLALLIGLIYVFRAMTTKRSMDSVAAGIAFGVGMLIKPILQFFPFILLGLMLPWARSIKWRVAMKHVAIMLATVFLVCMPWMYHNYRTFGVFTLSNQGPAAAFGYLATSIVSVRDHITYQEAEDKVVATFVQKYGPISSESEKAYTQEALGYMRANPGILLRLIVINTVTLWTSSNYNSFLNYYHLVPAIDHSVLPPTHYLAQGRIGDLITSFWKIFLQPFYIVGVLGRIVWTAILILFLYGFFFAYRYIPERRFQLLFIAALCIYWTMTIWVDGLGIEARLRYPLLPLELLFASYGWSVLRKKHNKIQR